jgi:thiol-disulfide isomerase/thioredoxin
MALISWALHAAFGMILLVGIGAAAEAGSSGAAPSEEKPVAAIGWQTSYADGIRVAEKYSRPVLIDFTASWCGWCRKMDDEVYSEPEIAAALAEYTCIKVDTDTDVDTALAYQVRSLPRTIILNTHREIVSDLVGYVPPESFKAMLEDVESRLRTKTGRPTAPTIEPRRRPVAPAQTVGDAGSAGTSDLVSLLGDRDPRVREAAAKAIADRGDAVQLLIGALSQDYLGARIAAYHLLRQRAPNGPAYDPWASRETRRSQAEAWQAWAAGPAKAGSSE